MNIFYLSSDPVEAAKYHCDKHCVKMIVEYAQLMSTAHRLTDSPVKEKCYRATHKNHPSSIWVRSSQQNYRWLWYCFAALGQEFLERRNKPHKTYTKLLAVLKNIPDIPDEPFSEPPQCMPDYCKVVGDSVFAYRRYYRMEKAGFAKWEWGKAETPYWW